MTIFNLSLAKHAAEAMGFDNLSEDVSTLLTQDTEYRLREIIQESKKFMRHANRTYLITQDILSAFTLKNIEPIYGFQTSRPVRYKKALDKVYYLDDEELDFDKVLATPLPKLPVDASITAHWLCIDGVQPHIPQNPAPGDRSSQGKPSSADKSGPAAQAGPGTLVKDALSREFQLYYQKITEAVFSDDPNILNAVLTSVSTDPGLQALVPYFINFCQDQISSHLGRDKCRVIVQFLQSLVTNSNVFVEPYLHQIVPLLLTLILSKRQDGSVPLKDTLGIRDMASSFLATLVVQYTTAYPLLIARITKTFLVAIVDDTKPLITKYGAVVGLALLGPSVVNATLVPYAQHYSDKFFNEADSQVMDEDDEISDTYLLNAYAAAIASLIGPSDEIDQELAKLKLDSISSTFRQAIQAKLCPPTEPKM